MKSEAASGSAQLMDVCIKSSMGTAGSWLRSMDASLCDMAGRWIGSTSMKASFCTAFSAGRIVAAEIAN